jgi:hypothetical protein
LATSLQALVPHTDGDHFVYAFRRVFEGRLVDSGIQVEHVSALHEAEQFEVSLSEDGVATGRVRFRDTGNAIWLLGEDDFPRGLHLAYDPPLPYAEVPLFRGTRRAATTATVTRLSDGVTVGALEVTQIVEAAAAPQVHSALGTFRDAVSMHTTRTLQSPDGSVELNTAVITVLGVGEIRFDGTVVGAPALHRELACATVGGHRLGDCRNLKARVEELESAGSTDLQ